MHHYAAGVGMVGSLRLHVSQVPLAVGRRKWSVGAHGLTPTGRSASMAIPRLGKPVPRRWSGLPSVPSWTALPGVTRKGGGARPFNCSANAPASPRCWAICPRREERCAKCNELQAIVGDQLGSPQGGGQVLSVVLILPLATTAAAFSARLRFSIRA